MDTPNPEWDGPPFVLFGREHLLALTVVVVFQVVLIWRFRDSDEAVRRRVRIALTSALWAQELRFHARRLADGTWSVKEMLPLHLCSQGVWLGGLMLLTGSQRLYEYVYFIALAGASQALLTPDIGRYGWPHPRFVQFFMSHGLIVAAPAWMTFAEGHRPTAKGAVRAVAGTIACGLALIPLNRRLGANYMFSARKPESASVLDALPPWPTYLWVAAALIAASYGALYIPWAVMDSRTPRPT